MHFRCISDRNEHTNSSLLITCSPSVRWQHLYCHLTEGENMKKFFMAVPIRTLVDVKINNIED